jgi:hypothetical protein
MIHKSRSHLTAVATVNKNAGATTVQKSEVVTSVVREGDWGSYRRSVAELISSLPDVAYDQQRDCGTKNSIKLVLNYEYELLVLQGKLSRCKSYLGNKIRSFRREPQILTGSTVETLAVENQTRRQREMPYFVELASLYRRMTELDSVTGR